MNPYINDVINVHVDIENWLGKGEGDVEALLARFSPSFSMITVGGTKLNFSALSTFFNAQKGQKQGLKIALSDIEILAEWPEGAVIQYSEKQTLPGQPSTLRHSTVVFMATDNGVFWQHLHETPAPLSE